MQSRMGWVTDLGRRELQVYVLLHHQLRRARLARGSESWRGSLRRSCCSLGYRMALSGAFVHAWVGVSGLGQFALYTEVSGLGYSAYWSAVWCPWLTRADRSPPTPSPYSVTGEP